MFKLILYFFKSLNVFNLSNIWLWTTYEGKDYYLVGWTKGKDTWLKIKFK